MRKNAWQEKGHTAMTGRKAELHYLEQLYKQSGNQILVLYGRKDNRGRQLVQEFCREKKSF